MESQALGTPLEPHRTVLSVVTAVAACQGTFIEGTADAAFAQAAASVAAMLTDEKASASPRAAAGALARGPSVHVDRAALLATIEQLQAALTAQRDEIQQLQTTVARQQEDNDRLRALTSSSAPN